MRPAILAATCILALTACGDDRPAPPPVAPRAANVPAPRARADVAALPASRVLDDRGGWDPPDDLLDVASRLGDPAAKAAASAEIESLPLARRIDVLRAGLRLRDTIGFREGSGSRTDVSRARELCDAAGGRFVASRIAEHQVPAPR